MNSIPKKTQRAKTILLIIFSLSMILLFFIFIESGVDFLISFLLSLFFFLIGLGPILNIKSGTFHIRKGRFRRYRPGNEYKRGKDYFKVKTEPIPDVPNIEGKIKLDFHYKKPLISKCEECGFTLTKFMKKCPKCGKVLD